jgi:hypothetical protein
MPLNTSTAAPSAAVIEPPKHLGNLQVFGNVSMALIETKVKTRAAEKAQPAQTGEHFQKIRYTEIQHWAGC